MTRKLWMLAMALLPALPCCRGAGPAESLALEEMTARYRAAESDDERGRLLGPIAEAFEELGRTGSEAYRIGGPPPDLWDMLIGRIGGAGDRRNPRWERVYSCGGFSYVTGFTCDVKHHIMWGGPQGSGREETWHPDRMGDFLLFDGEEVGVYPMAIVE